VVRILVGEEDEPQRETTEAPLRTGSGAREARHVTNTSVVGVRQPRGPQRVLATAPFCFHLPLVAPIARTCLPDPSAYRPSQLVCPYSNRGGAMRRTGTLFLALTCWVFCSLTCKRVAMAQTADLYDCPAFANARGER
jgi:hypothetical protein